MYRKTGGFLKYRKPDCWHEASDPPEDFRGGEEGGAFHCFCPRAPKTLVTPLPFAQCMQLLDAGF